MTIRNRRGSALILVLLMTLAVAAMAIAAIFMSSSAGLLSRFYDRERGFRYAAESGVELVRSRLLWQDVAVPDTGMTVLLAGARMPRADGSVDSSIRVNVYAAATGDTTGRQWPFVTLVAQAYDDFGRGTSDASTCAARPSLATRCSRIPSRPHSRSVPGW